MPFPRIVEASLEHIVFDARTPYYSLPGYRYKTWLGCNTFICLDRWTRTLILVYILLNRALEQKHSQMPSSATVLIFKAQYQVSFSNVCWPVHVNLVIFVNVCQNIVLQPLFLTRKYKENNLIKMTLVFCVNIPIEYSCKISL